MRETRSHITKSIFKIVVCLMACLLFAQCRSHHDVPAYHLDVLPAAPKYADPSQWYTTDATPATLVTVPSPFIPAEQQRIDMLTVHIDEASGLLFVDGYTGTDYIPPLIGKKGCYHSREIWLYRNLLRDNIARRTANYLKNK